jgi:hypothetical protein
MPDFESGAFNRSAISPAFVYNYLQTRLPSVSVTYDINYDIASSRVWLRASIKPPAWCGSGCWYHGTGDVLPASSLDLLQGTIKKIHFQGLLRKGSLQSLVLLLQAFNRPLRHSPHRLIARLPATPSAKRGRVYAQFLAQTTYVRCKSAIAPATSRGTTQNSILMVSLPLQFLFPANALILGCLTVGDHSTPERPSSGMVCRKKLR